MKRHVQDNLALDMSLQRSRSVWLALALGLVLIMLGGLTQVADGIAIVSALLAGEDGHPGYAIGLILMGSLPVAVIAICISRFREAGRRISKLRDDPAANVKPLPAPFESCLFGPYH